MRRLWLVIALLVTVSFTLAPVYPRRTGAPPAGGLAYTDPFTRADDTDLSANNPPDPPGTYNEYTNGNPANCKVEIVSNEVEFSSDHAGNCDNSAWHVTGEESLAADQCGLIQYQGNNSWSTNRGVRILLRAAASGDPGIHLENRCSAPDCASAKWELMNGTSTTEGLTADTDCDSGEHSALSVGHYYGACVTGTGVSGTRYRTWFLDSLTDSDCDSSVCDPEDAGTWGTPQCDNTPTTSGTDDGAGSVGFGLNSNALDSGDTFTIDNFSATENTP